MIDSTATARLADFFSNIQDLVQFADCKEIGVHSRGLMGETPLKVAVVRDDVRIVADLLEAGANPNLPGEDDCTPLHHAASHGHREIISLLLSHGASTTPVDIFGHTPADIARILNCEEAYALIVSKDA